MIRRALLLAATATVLTATGVQASSGQPAAAGVSLPGILASMGAPAQQVLARSHAEVTANVVRLGDLFSGLSAAQADIVVAHAPAPGDQVVFDQTRLTQVAAVHGVAWQPLPGGLSQVAVSRAAEMVSTVVITRAIAEALRAHGMPADADVELTSAVRGVPVAFGSTNPVGVSDVMLDPRSGRFTATLELPAGDPRATRLRVAGFAHAMVEVPVVTRSLGRDVVISEADLDWQRVRADRLPAGAVTEASQVVGMAARRALRAGEPLRAQDLARPIAVSRNDLVTMVVRNSFMTLTSRGHALEAGSVGDVVRVRNDRSNKVVMARIIDNRTVVVEQGHNQAALN